MRYPDQLHAALAIGHPGPCVDLYETVKALGLGLLEGIAIVVYSSLHSKSHAYSK